MEGESHLIIFPQSAAILKAGLFCDLVGMNQRAPLTTRQRVSETRHGPKHALMVPALSPCVGGKMGGTGLRLSITQCGWIMDTVLHSQPFANPCSKEPFPGCAERSMGLILEAYSYLFI